VLARRQAIQVQARGLSRRFIGLCRGRRLVGRAFRRVAQEYAVHRLAGAGYGLFHLRAAARPKDGEGGGKMHDGAKAHHIPLNNAWKHESLHRGRRRAGRRTVSAYQIKDTRVLSAGPNLRKSQKSHQRAEGALESLGCARVRLGYTLCAYYVFDIANPVNSTP